MILINLEKTPISLSKEVKIETSCPLNEDGEIIYLKNSVKLIGIDKESK